MARAEKIYFVDGEAWTYKRLAQWSGRSVFSIKNGVRNNSHCYRQAYIEKIVHKGKGENDEGTEVHEVNVKNNPLMIFFALQRGYLVDQSRLDNMHLSGFFRNRAGAMSGECSYTGKI